MANIFDRIRDNGLVSTLFGLGTEFVSSKEGSSLILGALTNEIGGDYFNPPPTPVGYQGDIPRYTAVRKQVNPNISYPTAPTTPLATTPETMGIPSLDRRPGSRGRRYFTDTVYAQPEEREIPTLAEAQSMVNEQAQGIQALQMPPTPASRNNSEDSTQGGNNTAFAPPSGVAGLRPAVVPADPNATNEIVDPNNFVGGVATMAGGGIANTGQGYYLGGATDGMADLVPASIDGQQEARLSDGEFVIPADVVSHLGNGNSDAGAKQLHSMMDTVRKARTGREEQGIQIDPNKFMPKMAQGGIAAAYNYGGPVQNFNDGSVDPITTTNTTDTGQNNTGDGTGPTNDTNTDTNTNTNTTEVSTDPSVYTPQNMGRQGALAEWAGDYTADVLGKGRALAETPYEAYTGPLTAGASGLQQQAFTGIGGLSAPTDMGGFNPTQLDATQVSNYMNPYLSAVLDPQIAEARRQSEIDRIANAGRLTKAGAYGGSRQAVMESEGADNLQRQLAGITGKGYASAYDRAIDQFNREQDFGLKSQDFNNQYGFNVLGGQGAAGATQRGIMSEGIAADRAQFEEEKLFPYVQTQFQKSLLEGLPVAAQETVYSQPSGFQNTAGMGSYIGQLMSEYPMLGELFDFRKSDEDKAVEGATDIVEDIVEDLLGGALGD